MKRLSNPKFAHGPHLSIAPQGDGEDRSRQRPGGGDSVLSRVSSRPHHRQDEAQHTLVFVFHMDRSHADNLHAALPQPHNSKNIEIF